MVTLYWKFGNLDPSISYHFPGTFGFNQKIETFCKKKKKSNFLTVNQTILRELVESTVAPDFNDQISSYI